MKELAFTTGGCIGRNEGDFQTSVDGPVDLTGVKENKVDGEDKTPSTEQGAEDAFLPAGVKDKRSSVLVSMELTFVGERGGRAVGVEGRD